MNTFAILLVVLSSAMHASRNYLTKKALDKQAFVWCYELVGMLLFAPLFTYYAIKEGISLTPFYSFILLSGVLHFFYWYFLTKSLETGDLSHVYPIMRSSPAIVLLFSLFILKEDVSLQGIIGILLVAAGSYSINMHAVSLSGFTRPLKTIRNERATQSAVFTLVSVAAYSIADKMAVEHIHPILFAFMYPWVSMSLFTKYLTHVKRNGELKHEWLNNKKSIFICGFLSIFGYFLILVAFTFERVSYIVGLRQLSIVFAVILGGYFLEEQYKMIRLFSAIIIFVGTFLIAMGA